jgi:alkylated DNA repair protein (DNA oxidative demethylase)
VPSLLPRSRVDVGPGAVFVPDWLALGEQCTLVARCREWARGPAGMRALRLPSGHTMSVKVTCVGWQWLPYRYAREIDGVPVAAFPEWLAELGRRAVAAVGGAAEEYHPDAALINFYEADARMGMHQDKDERSRAPVVSISIGDSCMFRFGNPHTRGRPYTDVELRSGDLFVFGGESRLAYHGVPKVLAGTGDPATGLGAGRLNITLRETGL